MMDFELLDNIAWHSLAGALSAFAVGTDSTRRLVPGATPIAAFRDPAAPDLDALARHCAPGEALYCAGWNGPVPAGWQLQDERTMLRMVWDRAELPPEPGGDIVPLGPADGDAALDLMARARYGPFGARALALGHFVGVREGRRLLAMAGERFAAGPWREICSVCTDPAAQGRGLASRLTLALAHRQLLRGERPFLHVMADNTRARALYGRLGFREHASTTARVVARVGSPGPAAQVA